MRNGHDDRSTAPHDSIGEAVEQLVGLVHPEPHALLGAHPLGDAESGAPRGASPGASVGASVVRAFRPEAEGVRLLVDDAEPVEMRRIHDAGLFEATLPRPTPFRYRFEARYPGGRRFTLRDPYGLLPTLGPLDEHLFNEGRHLRAHEILGAHVRTVRSPAGEEVQGAAFAVWAPSARGVSVVGDWNGWDGRLHPMRRLGASGIWELFVPDLDAPAHYKFEIRPSGWPGAVHILKSDPYARAAELPPGTASVLVKAREHSHHVEDAKARAFREARDRQSPLGQPMSVYEVHLGSWRRVPEEMNRPLGYREIGPALAEYVSEMGFTHVELLPVMEHPFGGSWGYQVSGYFAPTARFGTPDDFRVFVDALHARGIGVILDWVPAHFPRDAFSLGRFDGTALYEHLDPRQGEHPDWGTFVFNFGRNEVKNFLLSNALYWIEEFGIDGLRVDAVASMLYLDYSRKAGEWVPNQHGGRENLEAVAFLRELNEIVHDRHPGVLMIAEESTAWPGVSRPTYTGGLGFGFKWNMGWMHDTLDYFAHEPVHRRYHHNRLTFSLMYAFSENFVLPLSHDEVVHGKRSLVDKMPGDRWQKMANLRALYGLMWAQPGKKMLFMGGELATWREWNHDESLDWHLLGEPDHRGVRMLVADLNRVYRDHPALWEADFSHEGYRWIDPHAGDMNVVAFLRTAPSTGEQVLCVCNFAPVVRHGYKLGAPRPGFYRELLNTDSSRYAGTNVGNAGGVEARSESFHGLPHSIDITLPPLAALYFEVPRVTSD